MGRCSDFEGHFWGQRSGQTQTQVELGVAWPMTRRVRRGGTRTELKALPFAPKEAESGQGLEQQPERAAGRGGRGAGPARSTSLGFVLQGRRAASGPL